MGGSAPVKRGALIVSFPDSDCLQQGQAEELSLESVGDGFVYNCEWLRLAHNLRLSA